MSQRRETAPELRHNRPQRIKLAPQAHIANLQISAPHGQSRACLDQPSDLVRRQPVADRERAAQSFDLMRGQLHPTKAIELVFDPLRERA